MPRPLDPLQERAGFQKRVIEMEVGEAIEARRRAQVTVAAAAFLFCWATRRLNTRVAFDGELFTHRLPATTCARHAPFFIFLQPQWPERDASPLT